MKLTNKNVKIKVDNFLKNKEKLSPKFINFIESSRDKIFIAKQEKKYKGSDIYVLKDNDIWLFHEVDLEVVK